MAIIVKENALRALVREALDGSVPAQTPGPDDAIKINNVVDPRAAETNPDDFNFRPQDEIELKASIKCMLDAVPSEKTATVYDKVRIAVHDAVGDSCASSVKNNDDGKQCRTQAKGKMTKPKNTKQVEETIRRAIRLQLAESYGNNIAEADDGDEDDEGKGGKKRRGAYKDTALGQMGDEGTNFAKIATELGFSVSGAKQAVDKAMQKTKFLQTKMDPDDLEILILSAMRDYIDHLARAQQPPTKTTDVDSAEWDKEMAKYRREMGELGLDPEGEMGEISDDDIQLMKDHPDIVRTLPGFREFLHNYIRHAAKAMGEKIN